MVKKLLKKKIDLKKNKFYFIKTNLVRHLNLNLRKGLWLQFYYPIGGGCFYMMGGKIVNEKHKINSLNHRIHLIVRLSKERVYINMPTQLKHFSLIEK